VCQTDESFVVVAVTTKAVQGAKSLGSFLYSAVNKAGKTVSESAAKIKKTVEENVSTRIDLVQCGCLAIDSIQGDSNVRQGKTGRCAALRPTSFRPHVLSTCTHVSALAAAASRLLSLTWGLCALVQFESSQ